MQHDASVVEGEEEHERARAVIRVDSLDVTARQADPLADVDVAEQLRAQAANRLDIAAPWAAQTRVSAAETYQ